MRNPEPEVRQTLRQTYDPWDHMIGLVYFDSASGENEASVVAIGMGAFGPNMPFPLVNGFECESIAPRRVRV